MCLLKSFISCVIIQEATANIEYFTAIEILEIKYSTLAVVLMKISDISQCIALQSVLFYIASSN